MAPLRRLPVFVSFVLGPVASGWSQSAAAPELGSNPAMVPSQQATIASKIGMDFKLGATVPGDVQLTDDAGKPVQFAQLLGKRPVLLMPLFFNCQTACPLETDNLLKLLVKEEGRNVLRTLGAQAAGINIADLRRDDRLLVGRDFDVVMLSIHPLEAPLDARRRRLLVEDVFVEGWKKLNPADQAAAMASVRRGFHFLVGKSEEVHKITDAIGFKFWYDAPNNRMNHVAASAMLSPTGKVTGYITGTDYATKVLAERVALASRNEVGALGDTMMLGCIMVDPVTGKRTIVFKRVVTIGCILTMLILGGSILMMSRKGSTRNVPGPTSGGEGSSQRPA
ncbi:MAG: hypothetical protein C4320_04260 [Armatimonadota bacterium]